MTTRLPLPGNVWNEAPTSGASLPIKRLYWSRNVTTGLVEITTDSIGEFARLADLTGSGTYTLVALADIPFGTPVLRMTLMNGATTLFS